MRSSYVTFPVWINHCGEWSTMIHDVLQPDVVGLCTRNPLSLQPHAHVWRTRAHDGCHHVIGVNVIIYPQQAAGQYRRPSSKFELGPLSGLGESERVSRGSFPHPLIARQVQQRDVGRRAPPRLIKPQLRRTRQLRVTASYALPNPYNRCIATYSHSVALTESLFRVIPKTAPDYQSHLLHPGAY